MAQHHVTRSGAAARVGSRGRTGTILPVRLDGEPVSSAELALQLTWHIEPWETVVEAYIAACEAELEIAKAAGDAPAARPAAA